MRSLQKDLSGLIRKHQQLERKYFESQDNCSSKEANIKQFEDTQTKRKYHRYTKRQYREQQKVY